MAQQNTSLNKPEFCRQTPSAFGQIVETGKVSARIITTIPKRYAERLGIVEGLTRLECTLEDGALVYRPVRNTTNQGF